MKQFDVYGVCNPITDLLIHVNHGEIESLGLVKNSMNLVDKKTQQELLEKLKKYPIIYEAGGSGANTMNLVSSLGGEAVFNGKIGFDASGEEFSKSLSANGVSLLLAKEEGFTGSSIILIAPDASRTMNTCLGVCQNFSSDDLNHEFIKQSSALYVTMYCWDTEKQKNAVRTAIKSAKSHGVKVVLSLSDAFCVLRHKDEALNLLKHDVDIALMNLEELLALYEGEDGNTAIQKLSTILEHFIVTNGAEGSFIHKGGETFYIPAFPVKAIDTTGAGDSFAAGYLFGMLRGYSLESTGKLASFIGAKIVAQNGSRFNEDLIIQVKQYASTLIP